MVSTQATDAAHLDRASGRAACGFGPLPARLCAISRDGTLVVAGGAYCGALRVSEFDLERGSDGAGPLCCAPVGEASVVAHDAALTLVVAFDDDAGVFARCEGERPDVLVLVGAADGVASAWRVDRQRPWPKRARLRTRPEAVFRGHAAPIVAGDASRAADVAVTAAADGRVLVHALASGAVLRAILRDLDGPPAALRLAGATGLVAAVTAGGLLAVASVNGGPRVAEAALAEAPADLAVAGEFDDALLLVFPDGLQVRDLLSLAVVRSLTQHHFAPSAPPPRLAAAALAPDAATPAAVLVASDDGLLALRVFRGADAWADRRGAMHAGVSALVAKRATQVAGVIAGVLGRASDLSAATRDVVGEARASIKGSATFGKAMSLFRGSSSG